MSHHPLTCFDRNQPTTTTCCAYYSKTRCMQTSYLGVINGEMDDVSLVIRIGKRDRVAFETFYDRHAAQALGLAMRVLGERSLAEDVIQEAFWRIWTNASKLDMTGGNPRGWLLTVVRRLALDVLRRDRKVGLELDSEDENGEPMELADTETDVFEHVAGNLSQQSLRRAMGSIDERHREVIELAYFQGLTHHQIAQKMGQPLGTVHSWALRGMASLKTRLQPLHPEGMNLRT